MVVRLLTSLTLILPLAAACPSPGTSQSGDAQSRNGLVQQALANEIRAASDSQHPMRYRLRKQSPRLESTKEIFETKDGAVARLLEINNSPLSAADEEKEQSRLSALLADPGKQRHRKQSEDEDTARAMKVLRSLHNAFLYQYKGPGRAANGPVEEYTFRPNPQFDPPDLETQVLTQMTGEIWIDPDAQRVARLEGHLQQDVDFGWGILGRLSRGGWIVLQQADVGDHQWRTVRFQMALSGRVFLKTKVFDTTEDESHFVPVPLGTRYQQAIQMLRSEGDSSERSASASSGHSE